MSDQNSLLVLTGRDLKLFEAGEDVGWNAAIEAAANKAEANGTMCVAMEIRKLKK